MVATKIITTALMGLIVFSTGGIAGNAIENVKSALRSTESVVTRGRQGCGRIEATVITYGRSGTTDSSHLRISTLNNVIEVRTDQSMVRTTKTQMIGVYPGMRSIVVRKLNQAVDEADGTNFMHKMIDSLLSNCQVETVKEVENRRTIRVVSKASRSKSSTISAIEFVVDLKTGYFQRIDMFHTTAYPFKQTSLRYDVIDADGQCPEALKSRIDTGILDGNGQPVAAYKDFRVVR